MGFQKRCGDIQKFLRYRTWLSSLTEYVLVSQDQPLIERFVRHEGGEWGIVPPVAELEASIEVPSIACVLLLKEVYDRIAFPAEDAERTDGDSDAESRSQTG